MELVTESNPFRIEIPAGQYGTIYADPAWPLDQPNTLFSRRRIMYDRMSRDEIFGMGEQIKQVSHPDAHLWLWTTSSHIEMALQTVKHWGFTYKTMGVWRKTKITTGWWLRGRHEFLIFAAKSDKLRHNPGGFTTEISGKWRGHSVKPVEAYPMIEALSPGPRLELFARDKGREGWTVLGSPQKPSEAFGQLAIRRSTPEPQDTRVRGVGGLEIEPGNRYVRVEKVLMGFECVALEQKDRRVKIEITTGGETVKKWVTIDSLRPLGWEAS